MATINSIINLKQEIANACFLQVNFEYGGFEIFRIQRHKKISYGGCSTTFYKIIKELFTEFPEEDFYVLQWLSSEGEKYSCQILSDMSVGNIVPKW